MSPYEVGPRWAGYIANHCYFASAPLSSRLFALEPSQDRLMSLSNYTKDGILTVVFDDARILDETKLDELGRELTEMLNKTTEERVILDFRNVKFMSSSMLSKLVAVNRKAGEFKVKLKLCSIDPEIRQVFKITKLDKLFEIETDEASARAAFMKRGWFG